LVLGGALTFFQGYEFNATVIGMVVFGVAVSLALVWFGNRILK
jgi:hypothetical protein